MRKEIYFLGNETMSYWLAFVAGTFGRGLLGGAAGFSLGGLDFLLSEGRQLLSRERLKNEHCLQVFIDVVSKCDFG